MKNRPEIRDEEILLMGLCRLNFSDEMKYKIVALAAVIKEWNYFTRLSTEHGVAALVYHNIKKLGLTEIIPEECLEILHSSYLLNISRNAFHIAGTEEILGLLNKAGIKTVLLKGLALELTAYGNQGLRQMTDVDILVSRNDYPRVRKILIKNGYDSHPLKSGFHKPIMAWTGKHLPTLKKNGLSIDIHLELFQGGKNSLTEKMLSTASEIKFGSEKAMVPAPQIFFLFLVRHLCNHEFNDESQLRLYTDLVVLLEKQWEEIVNYDLLSLVNEAGMSKILAWKLELLRDLWGFSFPDWLNEFISKWYNPVTINNFIFFLKSPKNNKPSHPGMIYRKTISEIPGLHRKVLFILGDLFPSVRFMKERYSVKSTLKVFLYYPLRFGKLLRLVSK